MRDEWWRDAVVYQVYPRSWADSDGDGVGDLPGITSRLHHLVALGVDALWLSPFYVSPQRDGGYDVADHRDVDPVFGDLEAFDSMLARAHDIGLKVIVDVVPNHTSSDHAWFREALAAEPGSPARARYLFRDGRGPGGDEPPNNWTSNFGGPAWTRVPDGQWYLHLFDVSQPDLDWSNPEVGDEYESVLRFWLDRGVDGFRIDVAHGMVKADGLPDTSGPWDSSVDATAIQPMWDQPGVHEIHRRWRRVVDEYEDRILCAEAWVLPDDALARYVRADELHQSFNFAYLMTPWSAADLRHVITATLAAAEAVGAPQTWVLSNHDVVRHASRFGFPQVAGRPSRVPGIGPEDRQPDAQLGLRRARAATTVMLALPGSAYLYQGEELGLPEATRLPDDALRDPTWERSGHRSRGRDGCRVPMPWEGDAPSLGFGPGDRPWLPQPPEYADLAVDRQDGDQASTLELYRRLLRARRDLQPGLGRLSWRETPDDVLGLDVALPDGGTLTVLANLGTTEYALPADLEVLVTSDASDTKEFLAPDTAVWTRPVAP